MADSTTQVEDDKKLYGAPGLPLPPGANQGVPKNPDGSPFGAGDFGQPASMTSRDQLGGQPDQRGDTRSDQDKWLEFSDNRSGVQGFDAAAGRSGASAAASASRGSGMQATVDAYNARYGTKATVGRGGDRIDFTGQGGEGTDVVRDSGGGTNGYWWGGAASGGGGTGGGGGGNGGGGDPWIEGGGPQTGVPPGHNNGTGVKTSGPQGGDGWQSTTPGQGTDLFNALLKRSQQGLAVDPNDPIIKAQTDANNVQLERGRTHYLQQEAERGGSNANIGAEYRSSAEQVGQAGADFQSKLMGQELSARRQEVQQALEGMRGVLTDEQQLQLQEELANLTRAEQRYQFDSGQQQQESQFGRTLANKKDEFGRDIGQRGYEFDSNDRYRNSPLGPGN